jgi:GDP-4-dehydro-6-deoxy-D-mannose reductase
VNILVTGATGFVGGYLLNHLREVYPEAALVGTTRDQASFSQDGIDYHNIDLIEEQPTFELIAALRPQQIYHLAAQSFVPQSFDDPWGTIEVNVRAQLNIIRGCLAVGIAPRILIASSAEVYGVVTSVPIREDAPLRPASPYSVSKVTQDMLGLQYFLSHQMPIIRARAFNHIGPGQSERFVAPAFALQIARIEAGQQEPVLKVGDLSDRRDFTDVRDIVRAYQLLLEYGVPGEAYNIASGVARSIQSLLDTLLDFTDVRVEVKVDPDRLRPSKVPILQGDPTKLQRVSQWQPRLTFEQTLRDVLDDCRQRVKRDA